MSADEETIQKLVVKAASLLKMAPMLTVPQGRCAAKFFIGTLAQSIFGEDDKAGEGFQADGGISIKSGAVVD